MSKKEFLLTFIFCIILSFIIGFYIAIYLKTEETKYKKHGLETFYLMQIENCKTINCKIPYVNALIDLYNKKQKY